MENLRKIIDIGLVSNKKYWKLRWISKPIYTSHEIFENYLLAIREIKVTLTLNKPAYVRIRILHLSKVLM